MMKFGSVTPCATSLESFGCMRTVFIEFFSNLVTKNCSAEW